jgi:hypothetical protein
VVIASGPRLARVVTAALLVTPVRIVLGCVVLVAARLVGAEPTPAALAFGTAAGGTAFVILNDPRRRLWLRRTEPGPAPLDARYLSRLELVRAAIFPSTVGVTVLAVVALAVDRATLAALLAGVLAGMGLASLGAGVDWLLRERQEGREYYSETDGARIFERVRG